MIRSDNRGSESLFPMYLSADDGRPNFAAEFVADVAQRTGDVPSPEDLLGYIYALFHSPKYRERYASDLRSDFPRVLLPASRDLFAQLAIFGRRLIDVHLLSEGNGVGSLWPNKSLGSGTRVPAKDSRPLHFRVGGYAALTKWLQPKHRSSSDPAYEQIATAIEQTIRLMAAIDAAIDRTGGFPAAFA